jgi:transcriptional regulator with XRE-family HTH domain
MLGTFLKTKREEAGYSQGQIAKRLKYTSPQFVSNWERGISCPPIKILKTLADLYNVSSDELFELVLQHSVEQLKISMENEYNILVKRKKAR